MLNINLSRYHDNPERLLMLSSLTDKKLRLGGLNKLFRFTQLISTEGLKISSLIDYSLFN